MSREGAPGPSQREQSRQLPRHPCRRMQMRLPADLPPSMRGALITCDYFAKVKMKVSGGQGLC